MLDTLVDSSDCRSPLIPEEEQNDLKPWDVIIIDTSSSSSHGGDGGAKAWSTPLMESWMSSGIIMSDAVFEDVIKEVDVEMVSCAPGREEQKRVKWLLESRGSEQLSSIESIVLFVRLAFSAKFFWDKSPGICEDPVRVRLFIVLLVVVWRSEKKSTGIY